MIVFIGEVILISNIIQGLGIGLYKLCGVSLLILNIELETRYVHVQNEQKQHADHDDLLLTF